MPILLKIITKQERLNCLTLTAHNFCKNSPTFIIFWGFLIWYVSNKTAYLIFLIYNLTFFVFWPHSWHCASHSALTHRQKSKFLIDTKPYETWIGRKKILQQEGIPTIRSWNKLLEALQESKITTFSQIFRCTGSIESALFKKFPKIHFLRYRGIFFLFSLLDPKEFKFVFILWCTVIQKIFRGSQKMQKCPKLLKFPNLRRH